MKFTSIKLQQNYFSKQNRTGDPYAWQADITTLKIWI